MFGSKEQGGRSGGIEQGDARMLNVVGRSCNALGRGRDVGWHECQQGGHGDSHQGLARVRYVDAHDCVLLAVEGRCCGRC